MNKFTIINFIDFSILYLIIILSATSIITFGYGLGDLAIVLIITIITVIFSFLIYYIENRNTYYIISVLLLFFTIGVLILLVFDRGSESESIFL